MTEVMTQAQTYTFRLPWPPSINAMWRAVPRRGVILSARGRAFRAMAVAAIQAQRDDMPAELLTGRLAVRLQLYPPDRRKRDVDNLAKAPFDAITASAAVWLDDSQVDTLLIERRESVGKASASILVTIKVLVE
jgi:crossover junction endodeoxyribonuclease RusA